jgi:hypothetical protein
MYNVIGINETLFLKEKIMSMLTRTSRDTTLPIHLQSLVEVACSHTLINWIQIKHKTTVVR